MQDRDLKRNPPEECVQNNGSAYWRAQSRECKGCLWEAVWQDSPQKCLKGGLQNRSKALWRSCVHICCRLSLMSGFFLLETNLVTHGVKLVLWEHYTVQKYRQYCWEWNSTTTTTTATKNHTHTHKSMATTNWLTTRPQRHHQQQPDKQQQTNNNEQTMNNNQQQ